MRTDIPRMRMIWEDGQQLTSDDLDLGEGWASHSDVEVGIAADNHANRPYTTSGFSVRNLRQIKLMTVEVDALTGIEVPNGWHCTLPFSGGWAIAAAQMPEDAPVRLRYPVQCCMQWIEVFGDDRALSVMCLDPVPLIKDFVVWRSGGLHSATVSFPHLALRPKEDIRLPPIVTGPHDGGWEEAARFYRNWLASVVRDPSEAPQWLQASPAWAWASGKGQYADKLDHSFSEMPAVSERFAASGIDCVQLAAWVEHGHDTRYPDYVAGESLGGEQALWDAVERIHTDGRKLALYTNGRLLDPLSETAAENSGWKSWAVAAPEGEKFADTIGEECVGVTNRMPMPDWDPEDEVAKEIYGNVTFAVMCPGSEQWADVYSERLRYAAERYQIDGLYLDQVLGAVAVPCYSDGHKHKRPVLSWAAYHELLAKVRDKVKAERPEAYLATEGFSDIIGQYFDIAQSHNDWPGPCPQGSFPFPEMTRHAVPWLMQALGPVREDQWDMLKLAHAGASGLDIACFGAIPDGEFSRAIRQVMQWRNRFGQEMYRVSPVPCRVEGFPENRAVAVLGKRLIICWSMRNPSSQPLCLRVRADLPASSKLHWESLTASGDCDVTRVAGGHVDIQLPAAGLGIACSAETG